MRSNQRPPTPLPALAPERGSTVYCIESLTPIFHGGTEAKRIDPEVPFRVPSIRGMIRFWWRATSPITDLGQLRAREKEVFGGVFQGDPRPSAVRMSVRTPRSTPGRLGDYRDRYGYAIKVALGQEDHDDSREHLHREGASAELSVRIEGPAPGLDRAIAAWLLFGGIGGRWRKGFGAVADTGTALGEDALVARWRELCPPEVQRPWPTLAGSTLLLGRRAASPMEAWKGALDDLQRARQSRSVVARHREWGIDPASVPNDWARDDYDHFVTENAFHSKRAALGLPLQFRSRHHGTKVMNPAGPDKRMPSPVLLRPVRLADGGAVAVLLFLDAPLVRRVQVGHVNGTVDPTGLDLLRNTFLSFPGWRQA
jgi:CRISPR-associated protein Cmr1